MTFNEIIKGMTRQDIEKAAEKISEGMTGRDIEKAAKKIEGSDNKGPIHFACWKKDNIDYWFTIRKLLCKAYEIKHPKLSRNQKKGRLGKEGYLKLQKNFPDLVVVNRKELHDEIREYFQSSDISGEMREVIVKARVNQDFFRAELLRRYCKCCLCNVNTPDLLIASHIKPWSLSKPKERMDVENGFLMCPNHDKLFDKGWISFDESGKIMISKSLSEEVKKAMNVDDNMSIYLTDGNKEYLVCHRQEIFIDKE